MLGPLCLQMAVGINYSFKHVHILPNVHWTSGHTVIKVTLPEWFNLQQPKDQCENPSTTTWRMFFDSMGVVSSHEETENRQVFTKPNMFVPNLAPRKQMTKKQNDEMLMAWRYPEEMSERGVWCNLLITTWLAINYLVSWAQIEWGWNKWPDDKMMVVQGNVWDGGVIITLWCHLDSPCF